MSNKSESDLLIAMVVWVGCWLAGWLVDRMAGGNGGVGALAGVIGGGAAAAFIAGGGLRLFIPSRRTPRKRTRDD